MVVAEDGGGRRLVKERMVMVGKIVFGDGGGARG